jgi:hypothetical protein
MSHREIAREAVSRAGVSSSVDECVAALVEILSGGVKTENPSGNFEKDWTEDKLRAKISPADHFSRHPDHLNGIVCALLQMKDEAVAGEA